MTPRGIYLGQYYDGNVKMQTEDLLCHQPQAFTPLGEMTLFDVEPHACTFHTGNYGWHKAYLTTKIRLKVLRIRNLFRKPIEILR